ncbi:MAG: hypothetical protein WKF71_12130 [Pyrinomonadaceae bacterium]
MPENKLSPTKKSFSPDWFVGGILTRLGDMFDRFAGRNWQPSEQPRRQRNNREIKEIARLGSEGFGREGKIRAAQHKTQNAVGQVFD